MNEYVRPLFRIASAVASLWLVFVFFKHVGRIETLESEQSVALKLIEVQKSLIAEMEIRESYHKLRDVQNEQIIEILSKRWPEWEEIHKDKTCHEWGTE